MLITILKETGQETRVAATPAVVKHYIQAGFQVAIESKAGFKAGFEDAVYQDAGAEIFTDKNTILPQTSILLTVNEPTVASLELLIPDTLIIGSFNNAPDSILFVLAQVKNVTLLSMNHIPRLSRAQSMDSLSSQANLAGYRAVLEATFHYQRVLPMMMTAAGMIQPAKILVLGAGVAGLQAIATAKRLGAVVYAFDVRKAAREQVESLGAEFIEVSGEDAATDSGYASETSEDYKRRQAVLIDEYAKMADIIITTALIPDKTAPVLLYRATLDSMKKGSIIVDLATARGGNCELSEQDKTVQYGPVTILGNSNLPGLIPTTASELYANNLRSLLQLLTTSPGEINLNPEDEIIKRSVLVQAGNYLPFAQSGGN